MIKKISSYLKLMRVKHWIKNFLIFLPIMYSNNIFNIDKLLLTMIGFFSFCFTSSVVYIFNDIKDLEKDRKHKVKQNRPIASGKVGISESYVLIAVLLIVILVLNMFFIEKTIPLLILLIYLLLNVLYSCGLKNIPILDIVILVSGFVLRIIYGSNITDIEISDWLYLTVMSGSFFLGFGKRKNEIIKQGSMSRDVLKYYTKEYLDKFMYVCLILTIVFYSLWSIDPSTINRLGNDYMIYTIPLVIIIFMKYCLNIEGDSYGDPVDVFTSDKILMAISIIFVITVFILIYIL